MSVPSNEDSLIVIKPEVSSCVDSQGAPAQVPRHENNSKIRHEKLLKSLEDVQRKKFTIETSGQIEDTVEDKQRTGRYLAVGVTLIMLFIAFYNTVLRHATVLAGLLAPAIIMLLYILWLLYFAKKRKAQASAV